jgi:hypothetical protein
MYPRTNKQLISGRRMQMKKITIFLAMFIICFTLTVLLSVGCTRQFGETLPPGHNACKNTCTLSYYSTNNPSWFGYYCPTIEEEEPIVCWTNSKGEEVFSF